MSHDVAFHSQNAPPHEEIEMGKRLHVVDSERCNGDGLCTKVCPRGVIELLDEVATTVPGRADSCIGCGQCVAVCPTEALQLRTIPDEDFERLERPSVGYDEFLSFLRTRRSVRLFKDKPVDRETTAKILAAAATAPMGFPPHGTEVVVIDEPDELAYLLEALVGHYDRLLERYSNPIGRAFIRLATGREVFGELRDHVVEAATAANQAYRQDGSDRYMWGAPVLMLFHASRWRPSYRESAHLVCHHAMLAALSLGLGSTIIGMIPPVVQRSNELRVRYGIPDENKVLTSLILGHAKFRFRRGIRRDLAEVRFNARVRSVQGASP
ncbi:MAG: nitroreductase family protein [Deltaproteobacteria bacterium]|jgi:NAD-dependent dihydropyrimidine dehydrogenase PreA subunit/nitroreductase|nr:nitroreductase family protein [Deltaproteobacteria bacterium]MBW2535360.1 nitroreductase family protein [Deltaproteobacteria bacterium]